MNARSLFPLVWGSGLLIYAVGAFGLNHSNVGPMLRLSGLVIEGVGLMLLWRASRRRRVSGGQK